MQVVSPYIRLSLSFAEYPKWNKNCSSGIEIGLLQQTLQIAIYHLVVIVVAAVVNEKERAKTSAAVVQP